MRDHGQSVSSSYLLVKRGPSMGQAAVEQGLDESTATRFTPGDASLRRYAAVGLMLALCLAWLGCGGDPKPSSARANTTPTVPVSVSTAERRDMPYYLTGLGSVSAFYTVNIKTRVDGQLTEVNFKEGQFVNKGDLLAVIDPRPYQVVLDQSQATLFRDQAL